MQLNCPACGEAIPAENINIRVMAAVCPTCATVFPFSLPEAKVKRRKVKQPEHLSLQEVGQNLQIAFRTNFRLERNEAVLSSAILGLVFTFLTILLGVGSATNDVPLLLPLVFGLVALASYYRLALVVVNKTYITMGAEQIEVKRRPLPGLFDAPTRVKLANVVTFGYEETPISRTEGYDTPRYRLWAETSDGRRKPILNDLVEHYALFVSQRLNEALGTEAEVDVSRLLDEAQLHESQAADDTENSAQQGRP